MVALCEIAGIPARIITHTVGGHLTCEAYVDGEWDYFDPRTGFYCVKADGKPASLLELFRHPQLLDQQLDAVKANLSARWTWEMRAARCRERFFNPYEVNTIKPYSLADSALYTYGWTTNRDLDRAGLSRINAAYASAGDQTFGTRSSPRQPRLELTLPDGVLLAQPVPVLALPRDLCVPPRALRFSIDGEVVWTSPAVIPPSDVHICMEGAIPLFGERGLLDPSAFGEGVHTLFVQDINDESVYGQTTFLIQRSLQLP